MDPRSWHYAWNRPTGISSAHAPLAMALRYDGLGRLVWKRQSSSADPPIGERNMPGSHDWRLLEWRYFHWLGPR